VITREDLRSVCLLADLDAEAALARRFLDHPLRRIREWASIEERSALADARQSREWDAEQDIP